MRRLCDIAAYCPWRSEIACTWADGPVGSLVELALVVVLALLLLAAVELVVPRVAVSCLVCGREPGVVGNGPDLSRRNRGLSDSRPTNPELPGFLEAESTLLLEKVWPTSRPVRHPRPKVAPHCNATPPAPPPPPSTPPAMRHPELMGCILWHMSLPWVKPPHAQPSST